jgi:hypothetical protein
MSGGTEPRILVGSVLTVPVGTSAQRQELPGSFVWMMSAQRSRKLSLKTGVAHAPLLRADDTLDRKCHCVARRGPLVPGGRNDRRARTNKIFAAEILRIHSRKRARTTPCPRSASTIPLKHAATSNNTAYFCHEERRCGYSTAAADEPRILLGTSSFSGTYTVECFGYRLEKIMCGMGVRDAQHSCH